MGINGINNASIANQMTKTQFQSQASTSAAATAKMSSTTKANAQTTKPAAPNDISGRISNIPDLEQYGAVIQRFLSGESEMESADKPLTEDQIALRVLMREYQKTDMRTPSQMQADMQQANNNFFNYWKSSGNTGPMPGRIISSDGSFHIFNSKAEKDAFVNKSKMSFLENVMSVINTGKNNGDAYKSTGINLTV